MFSDDIELYLFGRNLPDRPTRWPLGISNYRSSSHKILQISSPMLRKLPQTSQAISITYNQVQNNCSLRNLSFEPDPSEVRILAQFTLSGSAFLWKNTPFVTAILV
jgi:hypothetical protein